MNHVPALLSALLLIAMGPSVEARPKPAARSLFQRLVRISGNTHKPEPPILISLSPDGPGAANRQRVRLDVQAVLPGQRLEIRVSGHSGLRVVGGESRWIAPARSRVTVTRRFTVEAAGAGELELRVEATLIRTDGSRVQNAAAWAAAPRRKTLAEEFPGAKTGKDGRGREILELPPSR